MNPPVNVESIAELLSEVVQRTNAHEYTDAMAILEIARSSDPGNIYISALKRQLEALISLSGPDAAVEGRRQKLLEPLVGIVECAIREAQKHNGEAGGSEVHRSETDRMSSHVTESGRITTWMKDDEKKKLEALKLLHFQRASKFVMKGEYAQAMEEVRRVFVVDPDNLIAKEYVNRVQQLIDHSKKAGGGSESGVRPRRTTSDSASQRRATAWDDSFEAPPKVTKIPEHGSSSASSRRTVAYGESLAPSLRHVHLHGSLANEDRPPRSSSRRKVILAAAAGVAILVLGAYAIFTPSGHAPGGTAQLVDQVQSHEEGTLESKSAGSIGVQRPDETVNPVAQNPPAAVPTTSVNQRPASVVNPVTEPTSRIEQAKPTMEGERILPPPSRLETKDKIESPSPALIKSMPVLTSKEPAAAAPSFVAVEKEPQILKLEKPRLPAINWSPGTEDQVIVRVLIDRDGKATQTQVLKSTNKVLENAVVEAVRRSQFSPGQMAQGPVASWLTIPFRIKHPK
jgi:TonB family protein